MEIQVGEYVRTNYGIAKIFKVHDEKEDFDVYSKYVTDIYLGTDYDTEYIGDDDILKHSFNIIDLIEKGDYVNGNKVDIPTLNINGENVIVCNDYNSFYNIKQINSILTKEQFEANEYKIEEV